MEKWKIFNLISTFVALILAVISTYLIFNIDILLVRLIGIVSLGIAIIIQMYALYMTYVRDVSIFKELKYVEGKLEQTRTEMENIPLYIETNNSKIDEYIKSNNVDMVEYIKSNNLDMMIDMKKYIDDKISQVINVIEERYRK